MRDQRNETRSLLSAHIRSIRMQRGLSLDDVASRSGVSRATLSRIENDDVSPTAETLGQLATAFAMPISQLIAPLEKGFQALVRREQQSVWKDEENGFLRRTVSPPSGRLAVELVEAELQPHQSIAYAAPAVPGHEHHLMLLAGALNVTVEQTVYDLRAGDCLRYQLFGPSRFETGPLPARYIIALC